MNKTQNQLWGDWRAMTHEHQEANYAMLATIRARALNTLDKMAPEQQTLALQYALDLLEPAVATDRSGAILARGDCAGRAAGAYKGGDA